MHCGGRGGRRGGGRGGTGGGGGQGCPGSAREGDKRASSPIPLFLANYLMCHFLKKWFCMICDDGCRAISQIVWYSMIRAWYCLLCVIFAISQRKVGLEKNPELQHLLVFGKYWKVGKTNEGIFSDARTSAGCFPVPLFWQCIQKTRQQCEQNA